MGVNMKHNIVKLDWSAGLSNSEIYRLAREGTPEERLRFMSSILNDDSFENIEQTFSCQEIEHYIPTVKFRRQERKQAIEKALSFWKKGVKHAFPRTR